ncbi:hypothetical protein HPP92_018131 [Vanilla planifolia]|nr:hypothetical protein HPP92_018131 [Vanilla planifolia]
MASFPRFTSSTFFRTLLRRFYTTSSSSNDGFVGSCSPVSRRDVPNSVAYRRSMLRPPPSVRLSKLRFNACSFIGTVVSQLRRFPVKGGVQRAFAFVEVKSDHRLPDSSCFR